MSFGARCLREFANLGLPRGPEADEMPDRDLSALPETVQRYLRWMGVPGRARDWSFRAGYRGRFRRGPAAAWMRCEAWQYNNRPAVARVMHLRVRIARLVPVIGRDTYLNGHGRMLIKLLDRITVGDGTGIEYDLGELVTYLNDGILMAPSMLMVPAVSWFPVDDSHFDVALSDRGKTVRARVTVDRHGAPMDFSTTDRFLAETKNPGRLRQACWTTPVSEWMVVDGRPLPACASAIWRLPAGDFPYAEFQLIPSTVAFNVAPGM